MIEDVRRRTACDRCHSQKLRCPKRPGADVCERCLRAKASCAYSPFRQKKPVELSSKRPPESANTHEQNFPASTTTVVAPNLGQANEDVVAHQDAFSQLGTQYYALAPSSTLTDLDLSMPTSCTNLQQPTPMTDHLDFDFDFDFSTASGGATVPDLDDLDLGMRDSFPTFDFNSFSPINRAPSPKQDGSQFRIKTPVLPSNPFSPRLDVEPPALWTTMHKNHAKSVSVTIPMALNFNFKEEVLVLDSVSKCVERLSKLSADLHVHAATIPFVEVLDPNAAKEDFDIHQALANGYRLEETFRVTQELIDVYPSILSIVSKKQISASDQGPKQFTGPIATMDHSTILLAISCHLRLTAIYEALFMHMSLCVHLRTNKNANPCQFTPIKIGSFMPSPSSAVPMQMLLIVHMSTQLSSFSDDLVAQIKGTQSEDRSPDDLNAEITRSVFELSLGAAENVSKKAHGITNTLSEVRNQMFHAGLLA